MIRFLLSLLLLTAPLSAQVITGAYVQELQDRQALLKFTTDTIGITGCRWGTAPDDLEFIEGFRGNATSGIVNPRQCRLGDLPPATKIYWSPTSCVGSDQENCNEPVEHDVTCADCGSGDDAFFADSSGLNVDNTGEPANFTTAALDECEGGPPCFPEAPTHTPDITDDVPVCAGSVTVDVGCPDFQAKMVSQAAVASGAGNVQCVLLRPGLSNACRPENESAGALSTYTLPNVTAPGLLVVKGDVDPKLMPPSGARVDPTYYPQFARIEFNADEIRTFTSNSLLRTAAGATHRGNWVGPGIVLGMPPWEDIANLTLDIVAIDTTANTITLDTGQGALLADGNTVVLNLTGTGVLGWQGPATACNISGDTFTPRIGNFAGTCNATARDLTGTYTSGGTVRRFLALPIEGHEDCGDGTHCITITGHNLPEFPDASLSAGSGSTITVDGTPSDYVIENNRTVWVQGNHANCTGLFKAGVSGSVLTLTGASDCNSSGTVRRMRPVEINQVWDPDFVKPQWHNVVDADTIQLLGVSYRATTGGVLSWGMDQLSNFYAESPGSTLGGMSDVTFDRVGFDCPMPCRIPLPVAVDHPGERKVVKNSWLRTQHYSVYDPISGGNADVISVSSTGPTEYNGFRIQRSADLQIVNNTQWPLSTLFSDSGGNPPGQNTNFSLRMNTLFSADWTVDSIEESDKRWYNARWCMELKSCDHCDIRGNFWSGCRVDFNNTGSAFVFSHGGESNMGHRDTLFQSNVVDRSGGGIHMATGCADGCPSASDFLHSRLWVNNNLFSRIEPVRYQSLDKSNLDNGYPLTTQVPGKDTIYTRNVFNVWRARNPTLVMSSYRANGAIVEDNVFVFSEGITANKAGVYGISSFAGSDAFEAKYVRAGAPDPISSFSGNVFIPGLESSHSGTYSTKAASADTADTICADELAALAGVAGLTATNEVIGATGSCDSLNTRLGIVFETGSWVPKAGYSTKGVDIDQLNADQGRYGPVSVTADHESATITVNAPDTDPCTVDLTHTTLDFSVAGNITRQVYSGDPGTEQAFEFGSLSPETQYAYRISCKRPALRGLLTTAGAP